MNVSKDSFDLSLLKELRSLFLKEQPLLADYWSGALLDVYARTLGERIRWKWSHVLKEISLRKIAPFQLFPNQNFLIQDWGCGPGTASFEFLNFLLEKSPNASTKYTLDFQDRSTKAMSFAKERIKNHFKTNSNIIYANDNKESFPMPEANTLRVRLMSYVLSEMPGPTLAKLLHELKTFDIVLWVDSGSRAMSQRLVQAHETLLKDFVMLAPCPHSLSCPLVDDKQNWCHTFADPPAEIFHSSEWKFIADELGFDLRSLPFHFLYFVHKKHAAHIEEFKKTLKTETLQSRILGRPRISTNVARTDNCTREGLYKSIEVIKSRNKKLYSLLKKETLLSVDDEELIL